MDDFLDVRRQMGKIWPMVSSSQIFVDINAFAVLLSA
jgi:hypothetical protein